MTVNQEQFNEVMDGCFDQLQPLLHHLMRQDDVYAAMTIGVLIGSFLTTRKSAADRHHAARMIEETVAHIDAINLERSRKLQ